MGWAGRMGVRCEACTPGLPPPLSLRAVTSAAHLLELRDLLDVARLHGGVLVLHRREVPLSSAHLLPELDGVLIRLADHGGAHRVGLLVAALARRVGLLHQARVERAQTLRLLCASPREGTRRRGQRAGRVARG